MSTRTVLRGKRFMLSVCVSVAAIMAATPSRAADINWTKAPVMDRGEFRAFVEGGVFLTGGDQVPYFGGFAPFVTGIIGPIAPAFALPRGAIPVVRPGLGWDAAIGADYRFAGTPWHVNMEGRFGYVNKIDHNSDEAFASTLAVVVPGAAVSVTANATTLPLLKESHWQADFGTGYDFMRGAQINFGFRVAELRSDIDALTGLNVNVTTGGATVATATLASLVTDRRAFFGAGPRVGLVGSVPILGAWTFDYSGNAAILFGNTKFSTGQVLGINVNIPGAAFIGINGITVNERTWSAPNTVYNFDIQGGVGYWVTPNWKVAVSYRLDAFIDPLRVSPDDGAAVGAIGPGRSMDRFYHGPKATLAGRF
jgi:hypothetical protein